MIPKHRNWVGRKTNDGSGFALREDKNLVMAIIMAPDKTMMIATQAIFRPNIEPDRKIKDFAADPFGRFRDGSVFALRLHVRRNILSYINYPEKMFMRME